MFFFFNDTATTEIYTLSLHDALPISDHVGAGADPGPRYPYRLHHRVDPARNPVRQRSGRSEEHTSELQSLTNIVCRLLLEKKKRYTFRYISQSEAARRAVTWSFAYAD